MNGPARQTRRGLGLVALGVGVFLYVPIAMVVVGSFNAARHGLAWEGFTLRWYASLFENREAQEAAINTLQLAMVSTALATMLGTALGYVLARHPFPGRPAVQRFLQLPVFVPDLVLAAGLVLFFQLTRSWLGLFELGFPAMLAGHVTFQIPFVAMVVRARLAGLDPALEEAAHDLGADARAVFRHVTLPLMAPGVAAGALLAFTLSLDDFVVSYFTGGPGSMTLPVLIYTSVRRGLSPEIHALSALLILASVVITAAVLRLQRRR
ncbi:MAG: spermidine/putrescine transporter, permease protein PotC [Verrucomicrobiota bacterium]|jgi:spermidine/putrescine transport system permease protein